MFLLILFIFLNIISSQEHYTNPNDNDIVRIFYHLEKCAGTTIEQQLLVRGCKSEVNTRPRQMNGIVMDLKLERELGLDYMPQLNWAPISSYTDDEQLVLASSIKNNECITGHYLLDITKLFSLSTYSQNRYNKIITFTIVRNPLTRLISLWNSWLGGRFDGTFNKFINLDKSIKDYNNKDNYYIRVLCPQAMYRKPFGIQYNDFLCAISNLQKLSVVLTVENLDATKELLIKTIGLHSLKSRHYEDLNKANSRRHASSESIYNKLNDDEKLIVEKLIKYDKDVYNEGKSLEEKFINNFNKDNIQTKYIPMENAKNWLTEIDANDQEYINYVRASILWKKDLNRYYPSYSLGQKDKLLIQTDCGTIINPDKDKCS